MRQGWFLASVVLLLVPSLLVACGAVQDEHAAVIVERGAALAEVAPLQSDYDDVSAELAETKKVYPPGGFGSVTELEAWVRNHVQPETTYLDETFRSALMVQWQGLEDGYLISVAYDEDNTNPHHPWVYCASVNGVLHTWYLDDIGVHSYADYNFTR